MLSVNISDYIESFLSSSISKLADINPWDITNQSSIIVNELVTMIESRDDYKIVGGVAIHKSAEIENGAILKGPLVIGPRCFVASNAYLRGGNWLEADCILGPGVELKSSFIFSGTKLAHFNFVGDSILGSNVNLEAGSIVANYRNERESKDILIRSNGNLVNIGVEKFGAVIGDNCRIGANAVIAPGSLLQHNTTLERLGLLDQEKHFSPYKEGQF